MLPGNRGGEWFQTCDGTQPWDRASGACLRAFAVVVVAMYGEGYGHEGGQILGLDPPCPPPPPQPHPRTVRPYAVQCRASYSVEARRS